VAADVADICDHRLTSANVAVIANIYGPRAMTGSISDALGYLA
jgi:hypothetical protein